MTMQGETWFAQECNRLSDKIKHLEEINEKLLEAAEKLAEDCSCDHYQEDECTLGCCGSKIAKEIHSIAKAEEK